MRFLKITSPIIIILIISFFLLSFKNESVQIETITVKRELSSIKLFYSDGTSKSINLKKVVESDAELNRVLNELGKEGYEIKGVTGTQVDFLIFLQRIK